ncbi:MAG: hypothetical protein PWP47_1593 [Synergistaceae bacterium]|jgi:predicted transcriptional regulator|nr:hypothetical protein [Synergistaceae bacterium]
MAGITAFDIIGELKSLEEKGIIDSGVRKKWRAKVVNEGVTEEIIEQMAIFKMREMEIRQGEQIRDAEKKRAVESQRAEPSTTESITSEIQTVEPEPIPTSVTVSDIITELKRLVENGVIDSKIGKKWESKAVKEGVTEEIISHITAFRKRENEVRKEAEQIAKSKTGPGSGFSSGNTKAEGTTSSIISIIALVLGIMGFIVPFIAAVFIVPVALALGCVSVHRKEKFGKAAVVLALIGIAWMVFVSSELIIIYKDPLHPIF